MSDIDQPDLPNQTQPVLFITSGPTDRAAAACLAQRREVVSVQNVGDAVLALSTRGFAVIVVDAALVDAVSGATSVPIVATGHDDERLLALRNGAVAYADTERGSDLLVGQVEAVLRLATRIASADERHARVPTASAASVSLACVSPGTLLSVLGMEQRTVALTEMTTDAKQTALYLENGKVVAALYRGRMVSPDFVVRAWIRQPSRRVGIASTPPTGMFASHSEGAEELVMRITKEFDEAMTESAA